MRSNTPKKTSRILIAFICLGVFFRFYNLTWGNPYFFHPDERNIASAVTQLEYPGQLNPHFFAYGTLPIYIIYFFGVLSTILHNFLNHTKLPPTIVLFEQAAIISRLFSFFLSTIMLQLIYFLGKKVGGNKTAMISLILSLFSVGLLQYTHFGTFEIWLTFFLLLLCYLLLRYYETFKSSYILFGSIILGFLFSVKISSLIYLPLFLIVILYCDIRKIKKEKKKHFLLIEKLALKLILTISIPFLTLYFTSPYYWLDNSSFLNSMTYESGAALGKYIVFYTQEFIHSIPFLFQFLHIYPFLLNPFVTLSVLFIAPLVVRNIIKKRDFKMLLILLFLLLTFLSQAFLFVKWTRYYLPTLPFIYIVVAKGLELYSKSKKKKKYVQYIINGLVVISLLYSSIYFKVALVDRDTRLQALSWAKKNIQSDAKILTEPFDLGIIPFNPYFSEIKIFDFYQLDTSQEAIKDLEDELKSTQFIILPSQRIVETRLSNPKSFPQSSKFYKNLFTNKVGFSKVYETECDIFCLILYAGSPVYSYEQTVNVFDRPTVFIFKKIRNNQNNDKK